MGFKLKTTFLGTIAGGVIGGILGFSSGGPPGAVFGAIVGSGFAGVVAATASYLVQCCCLPRRYPLPKNVSPTNSWLPKLPPVQFVRTSAANNPHKCFEMTIFLEDAWYPGVPNPVTEESYRDNYKDLKDLNQLAYWYDRGLKLNGFKEARRAADAGIARA